MIPRCPECGLPVNRARTVGRIAPWACTVHGEITPRWTVASTVRSRQTNEERRKARRKQRVSNPGGS